MATNIEFVEEELRDEDAVKKPKLYVIVPCNGRSEESIQKSVAWLIKMAKAYFEIDEFDVSSSCTNIDGNTVANDMAIAATVMSKCEYCVGPNWFRGMDELCLYERQTAEAMKLNRFFVNVDYSTAFEDVVKKINEEVQNVDDFN